MFKKEGIKMTKTEIKARFEQIKAYADSGIKELPEDFKYEWVDIPAMNMPYIGYGLFYL